MGDGFMTSDEAAAYLKVSPLTIYRWRKHPPKGKPPFPVVRIGRTVRHETAAVHAWATGVGLPSAANAGTVDHGNP